MKALLLVVIVGALLLFLVLDLGERAVEPSPTVKTVQQWGTERPPYVVDSAMFTTTTSAPVARARTAPKVRVMSANVWDAIANCESGGRWDDQRGGYEGGVHFLHSTWLSAGGRRYAEHAYQATREQQIQIATEWLARTSWSQWPECSRRVGVR